MNNSLRSPFITLFKISMLQKFIFTLSCLIFGTNAFSSPIELQNLSIPSDVESGTATFNSSHPLSADGKYFVFQAKQNGIYQIFLKDLQSNEITLITKNELGQVGNNDSGGARISADGNTIIFLSMASNLALDTLVHGFSNIVVYSRLSHQFISITNSLVGFGQDAFISSMLLSDDGNTVTYVFIKQYMGFQYDQYFYQYNVTSGQTISRVLWDNYYQKGISGSVTSFFLSTTLVLMVNMLSVLIYIPRA